MTRRPNVPIRRRSLVATNLTATLRALLQAKNSASAIERRFLQQLARLLPAMTVNSRGAARTIAPRSRARRRALRCPKCSRRFALPLHLGRHVSATHARRRGKAETQ